MHFRIVEHTLRSQHSRERAAGAELGRENELRLHVKQYVPKTNATPKPGDATIIGAQANGFPKEMYEPFWDDFFEQMQAKGCGIRSIWIADIASQGQSGVLNESLLGPEASWWDHGRDLLFLINQVQDEMPHPIVGIGHSVGASQLTHLSLLHPRLLHSLVLVDPIMQRDLQLHTAMARLSTSRRDVWPSREVAARKFSSSKFYQNWDARVLKKWVEYGLRDLPTEQYPEPLPSGEAGGMPVTLSTTRAQEVYFYVQAAYREARLLQGDDDVLRDIHPDDKDGSPFSRPESQQLYRQLPEVRPSVLYVFGKKSEASTSENQDSKMRLTGSGVGGSGGVATGRVRREVLDSGHLVAFEKTGECARASAAFLVTELHRWNMEERRRHEQWSNLSRRERVDISDAWRNKLGLTMEQGSSDDGRSGSKL